MRWCLNTSWSWWVVIPLSRSSLLYNFRVLLRECVPLPPALTPTMRDAVVSILKLWLPASLQMVTDWTRPLLFNLFVSHNLKESVLSPSEAALEEDAVGVSVISLNLILFATAYGFNGAVDSYSSVAFGAGDRTELLAVICRQLVLLCGLAFLALLLLANVEHVFLLIGLPAELAQRAAELLHLMGWAVPGDFIYDALSRWMRGQQLHKIVAPCSVIALAINLLVNLTLSSHDEPTRGPLLALVAQNSSLPVMLLVAYRLHGSLRGPPARKASSTAAAAATTPWPSARAILGPALWRQLRTAIAAMCWTCAELWAWEVQVFEASGLGPGNAAAYEVHGQSGVLAGPWLATTGSSGCI